MNTDDFEKQLQEQPMRSVPSHWRSEILEAARALVRPQLSPLDAQPTSWWREFLLSWRWHLAGMSAAWVVIALLNINESPAPAPTIVKQDTASPRQLLTALRENRRQLLEEIDPAIPEATYGSGIFVPRRRSELPSSSAVA
jgi:hypothetical protein